MRRFFATLSVPIALITGDLVATSAHADTGGPAAPSWHWYDSNQSSDPHHGYQDLSDTGTVVRFAGSADTGTATVTTPFPVNVNGATSSNVVVSTDGYATFGGTTTLAINPDDLVTNELFVQTLGAAPHRQFVINAPSAIRYGSSYKVPYSLTFFEGTNGVLTSYGDITGTPTGHRGLANSAWTGTGSTPELEWTGDVVDNAEVFYTDAPSAEVPALIPVSSDSYGYHLKRAGDGAPTGSYDLDDTGKVVLAGSDYGTATLNLPFSFDFYGTTYTQMRVGADTAFSFGPTTNPSTTGGLGSSTTTTYDAYDQYPDSGMLHNADWVSTISVGVRGTAPHRQYVVQWAGTRYSWAAPEAAGKVQLVLFEGSQDLAFLYPNAMDLSLGDLGVASVAPIISHDSTSRHRDSTRPVDGSAILWTTDPAGSRTLATEPAGSSSPDSFGYRAIRSGNAGGPTYSWIDTSDGTSFLNGSDTGTATLNSPFPLRLYGTEANVAYATTDGVLYVGGASSGPVTGSSTFPDASRPLLIQPYTTDLVTTPGIFTKTIGTAPHRQFVVTWDAIRYGSATLHAKYQVVFSEDSTDVLTQYAQIEGIVDAGNPSLVGINKDGESRLRVSADAADIDDASAILYTTRDLVSVSAPTTIRPDGAPVTLTTSVVNTGLGSADAVRQEVTLDGPAADADDLTLEAFDGSSWVEVALTGSPGSLSAIVPTTDGDAFAPGTDLTTPLRITAAEGAATGALNIGTVLHVLTAGVPTGVYASANDATQIAVTEPDAPQLTLTPGDRQVTLDWTPTSNGGQAITGYTLTQTPGNVTQTVGAGVATHTFTGLTNGTQYTFEVTATNGVGDSSPGSGTATPFGVPGAPGSTTATPGDTTATVTWTAPNTNGSAITGYKITRNPGNTTTTAAAGETTHQVTGLTNGTEYTFTVVATNLAGDSDASASTTATPFGVPGAPGTPAATTRSNGLSVSWGAADENGRAISSYTVTAQPGNHIVTTADGSTRSAVITGLTNGTAYTVTVTATSAGGTSAASAPSTATPSLAAVSGLRSSGALSSTGTPVISVNWTLPADATSAKVCVVAGSAPAAAACTGAAFTATSTTLAVPAGSGPITVTVFGRDANSQGPGASSTLTRSAGNAGPGTAVITSTAKPVRTYVITGAPSGARTATLFRKLAGSTVWTQVLSRTATGTLSAALPATTTNAIYQWRYAGGSNVIGTATNFIVNVKPIVTLTRTPAVVKKGKSVTLWGTLKPALPGAKVILQRKVGAKWIAVGKPGVIRSQKMPNGKVTVGFAFVVKQNAQGTFTYRISFAATTKNAATTSGTVSVKVK